MFHLVNNLTNRSGDALVGYFVKLKDGDGNYATLFSDANSTPIATVSGVADAAKTDENGMYDIYVADGDYDIEVFDKNDISQLVSRTPAVPMYGLQANADLEAAVTAAEEAKTDAEAARDSLFNDLASTDTGKGAALVAGAGKTVATRAAMAALTSDADKARPLRLIEEGRAGLFVWDSSDLSAEVTIDTEEGVYVAPDSDDTGASGAWVRQYSGLLNVKWFGSAGNGTTVDDDAIAGAMALLDYQTITFEESGAPVRGLHWPQGVYRITTSGLLSSITGSTRGGYLMTGEGQQATILWLDTTGAVADMWFYDNGATMRTFNCVWRDMCFSGGKTWETTTVTFADGYSEFANGFKHSGPGWESGHQFHSCEFRWLKQVHETAGANNADTIRTIGCYYIKVKHLWKMSNPQSFGCGMVSPYVGLAYGNILTYGSGVSGGGNFYCYGGDIVMDPDQGDESRSWIVDASVGGPASANAPIVFHGTRFELRNEKSSIATASFAASYVQFDGCSFYSTATADKPGVVVGGNCTVRIANGSFLDNTTGHFTFEIVSSARLAKNAWLHIENMRLDETFHSKVTWTGGAGRLTLDKCFSRFADYTADPRIVAFDCDICGTIRNSNTGFRSRKLKSVELLISEFSPGLTGTAVQLPPYSTIKGVYLNLPAGSGSASTIRYQIGNGDKSTVYGASATAAQNAGHSIDERVLVNVGTDANARIVRIWDDDGAGGAASGSTTATPPAVVFVEYY